MVVLDASFVLLMLEPSAPAPKDPTTGNPVGKCKERIEHLVDQLTKARTPVVVPAPALAEVLIRAGRARAAYLDGLQSTRAIKIEPFGTRAAVECAALLDGAIKTGKRRRRPEETWAKLKYDRQILAIAKVLGAATLYTTDDDLSALAERNGIHAVRVHELELPPVDAQIPLLPPAT